MGKDKAPWGLVDIDIHLLLLMSYYVENLLGPATPRVTGDFRYGSNRPCPQMLAMQARTTNQQPTRMNETNKST